MTAVTYKGLATERLPGGGFSVLLVVILGEVLRQGVNRLGGDWLSISCFVENKGSNWVRFVIWFWVHPRFALQSRATMGLATGSVFLVLCNIP
jgi:hypothetical protein